MAITEYIQPESVTDEIYSAVSELDNVYPIRNDSFLATVPNIFDARIIYEEADLVTCGVTVNGQEIGEMDAELPSSTKGDGGLGLFAVTCGDVKIIPITGVSSGHEINNGSQNKALEAVAVCLKKRFPELVEVRGLDGQVIEISHNQSDEL